jgi:cytochrome P450
VELLVRYDDVRSVLSDESRFEPYNIEGIREVLRFNPSAADVLDPILDEVGSAAMLNQVGRTHHELRALFSRAFTPRSVNTVRPFIRSLTASLVAKLEPDDDFVESFAAEVPALTLCELIGIPQQDRDQYVRWTAAFARVFDAYLLLTLSADEAAELVSAVRSLIDYSAALVRERRERPHDDLVSRLATDPECPIDDTILAINIAMFIFGGNDTTQRSMAQMVLTLGEYPDLWDQIAANPALVNATVEECLRFAPPVLGAFRRVANETQFHDTTWCPHQVLVTSLLSANCDEGVFGDDSTMFDPHRTNAKEHLAFGHGSHFCLGASLARAELQETLGVLVSSITCPTVNGHVELARGFRGPAVLPITFRRRH